MTASKGWANEQALAGRASWSGTKHQDEVFVEKGIWILGWEDGRQPLKAAEMQKGDRIAIRRTKGRLQTGIKILHIGIIRGVTLETNIVICTVDWVAPSESKRNGKPRLFCLNPWAIWVRRQD